MATSLKQLLVGAPLETARAVHERLDKKTALAVFSSDALSSTAYATEEILRVLAVAVVFGQTFAFLYVIPISIGIVILLAIVAISYRQTIYAYPSGGGAYIVAKENLGTLPGLTAAAALLIDYILTVSVSIAAGVAAITSAVQGTRYAWLQEHTVSICLVAILAIAIANLRGVRESGKIFAAPTYLFLCSFLIMICCGLIKYLIYGAPPVTQTEIAIAEGFKPGAITLLLLLSAFSNGCSALTGIEAISNGVPAFKQPESRNAATTLIWMSAILITLFLCTSILAHLYHIAPNEKETVISQFARLIFTGPTGFFYYFVQASTAAILLLAANTSFADFPRLSSLLARDGFLPRQFTSQGDRLVFSNGIIILALLSAVLLVIFRGDTHRLMPLYAVGVFLSFTLSQVGMVVHWWRERERSQVHTAASAARLDASIRPEKPQDQIDVGRKFDAITEVAGWRKSIIINGLGAVATAIVLAVFVITKFIHGAWIVVVLIPLLVMLFQAISRHYRLVAKQLTNKKLQPLRKLGQTVVVPISGVHNAVIAALEYAGSISNDVHAVYVDVDPKLTEKIRDEWRARNFDIKLVVLDSPYRSLVRPLLNYIEEIDDSKGNRLLTVVLPEFVPAKWWHHFLHNQSSFFIKAALLFRPGTVVTSVPFHLEQ